MPGPEVAALVGELNTFGEDTEPQLIASMYRHLGYWPAYLALVRTMLAPLQQQGRLQCAHPIHPRARACPRRRPGEAAETADAAGDVAIRARLVPPVRRTSDRAHDRDLRADPAGDRPVTGGDDRAVTGVRWRGVGRPPARR